MLNLAQLIRFTCNNPSSIWPELTNEQVRYCSKRMGPHIDKWDQNLQNAFYSNISYKHAVIGDPMGIKVREALLVLADTIEAEDNAPPVPPRQQVKLTERETYKPDTNDRPARNGAENYKQIASRGNRT